MRTWVPPSRADGQTGQKEKKLRTQLWAEMPLEPCLETSALGPWRGRPLLRLHSHGNPEEWQQPPPGITSCLSSRALWSPHLYRVGAGEAGGSELQTCLPSSLRFSSSARCAGQGGDRRRAQDTHPAPSSREPQGSGRWRGQGSLWERISPSFWWQISHFQG